MSEYFQLGVYKDENGSLQKEESPIPKIELSNDKILSILGANGKGNEQIFAQLKVKENYQNPRIQIAGFGGQGVLLMGLLLSESAMLSNYHSTWLPSYGPEMRGGTAHCHVNISDKQIGSPLVTESDVLIAMNSPSLDKFENDVRKGGLIMVNSSLIKRKVQRKDIETVYIPATGIADELGVTKVANVVMLGAYLGYTGLLSTKSILSAIKTMVKKKALIEINEKAINRGNDFVLNQHIKSS